MNNQIKRILNDLYRLDQSLRTEEKFLVPLIEKLLRARPDMRVDSAFIQRLRQELIPPSKSKQLFVDYLITFFSMKKISYMLGGAALAVLLLIPILYTNMSPSSVFVGQKTAGITSLGSVAFGPLVRANTTGRTETGTRDVAVNSAPAIGLGGGGGGDARMMIYPSQWNFTYVYRGGALDTLPATMPVYRRVKGFAGARELGSSLSQFKNGLVDLTKLRGAEVRNFDLTMPGNEGYTASVNVGEGYISISKNNGGWVIPTRCIGLERMDESCNPPPMTIDQVPGDEEVIKIASNFLTSFGIDTTNYGVPYVDNNWRIYYDQTPDKSAGWIPDSLTVVYPLLVDGQIVRDFSGNPFGLQVNVSLRSKEGIGIWNLMSQQYEKSEYQIEQNNEKILEAVRRGGATGYGYGIADSNGQQKTQEVVVGTPTIGLVQHTQWDDKGEKLIYVPAYFFPIQNPPKDFTGMKFVVVPLPKEILDQYGNNTPIPLDGPIQIMKAEPVDKKAE